MREDHSARVRRFASLAAIILPLIAAFAGGAFLLTAERASAHPGGDDKPVLTYTIKTADTLGYTGAWTNQNVTLDWTCTVDPSHSVASQPLDVTYISEGTTLTPVAQKCTDNNVPGSDSVAVSVNPAMVKIDKTKPELSYGLLTIDGAYTPGTWTNLNVTVTWSCTGFDGDVAPMATEPGPPYEVISAEGKTTVSAPTPDCADEAGNIADVPTLPEVWIDKTKPVLTYTLEDSMGVVYSGPPHWTALTVTLAWTCTDPTTNAADVSGVDVASFPAGVMYATTGKHPTPQDQTCSDVAGNESDEVDVDPAEVWIDKTKPYLVLRVGVYKGAGQDTEVPGPQGPVSDAMLNKWYPHRVAIEVTCKDDHSGVAANSFGVQKMFFTQEGKHTLVFSGGCVDNVGNVADVPVGAWVGVDTRGPSCRMSASNRAKIGATVGVKINVTGSDVTSGVASKEIISITPGANFTGAAFPAPSGTQWMFTGARGRFWTATGKVTDMAGNSNTCTFRVASVR